MTGASLERTYWRGRLVALLNCIRLRTIRMRILAYRARPWPKRSEPPPEQRKHELIPDGTRIEDTKTGKGWIVDQCLCSQHKAVRVCDLQTGAVRWVPLPRVRITLPKSDG